MLPNQLKRSTNPLVALETNTGLDKQEHVEPSAGSYVVEDTGADEDVVEADGDCNSKLKTEEYK